MSHIRNLEFLTKREEMHVLMIAGALLKKDDPVNAAVNVGAMHVNNISKSLATLVPNLQIHKIHALPTPSLKYLPQPCPPHFITDPTSKKGESVDLSADRDIRTTKEQARGFVAIIKDKLKKEPAVAASKTPAAEAFKPILGEKPTKPLKIKKANEM
jgi:hypothetical protein